MPPPQDGACSENWDIEDGENKTGGAAAQAAPPPHEQGRGPAAAAAGAVLRAAARLPAVAGGPLTGHALGTRQVPGGLVAGWLAGCGWAAVAVAAGLHAGIGGETLPACPPPSSQLARPAAPPSTTRTPHLFHRRFPCTLPGHRLLRAPVCGAAAAVHGRRRARLPGLHLAVPQVGLARRQVRCLLCPVAGQAVGAGCGVRGRAGQVVESGAEQGAHVARLPYCLLQRLRGMVWPRPPRASALACLSPCLASCPTATSPTKQLSPKERDATTRATPNPTLPPAPSPPCSYIVKQLSRSERQSFLEFAPDYFRYVATMLHRGQDTCLAKILGVFQVGAVLLFKGAGGARLEVVGAPATARSHRGRGQDAGGPPRWGPRMRGRERCARQALACRGSAAPVTCRLLGCRACACPSLHCTPSSTSTVPPPPSAPAGVCAVYGRPRCARCAAVWRAGGSHGPADH